MKVGVPQLFRLGVRRGCNRAVYAYWQLYLGLRWGVLRVWKVTVTDHSILDPITRDGDEAERGSSEEVVLGMDARRCATRTSWGKFPEMGGDGGG